MLVAPSDVHEQNQKDGKGTGNNVQIPNSLETGNDLETQTLKHLCVVLLQKVAIRLVDQLGKRLDNIRVHCPTQLDIDSIHDKSHGGVEPDCGFVETRIELANVG